MRFPKVFPSFSSHKTHANHIITEINVFGMKTPFLMPLLCDNAIFSVRYNSFGFGMILIWNCMDSNPSTKSIDIKKKCFGKSTIVIKSTLCDKLFRFCLWFSWKWLINSRWLEPNLCQNDVEKHRTKFICRKHLIDREINEKSSSKWNSTNWFKWKWWILFWKVYAWWNRISKSLDMSTSKYHPSIWAAICVSSKWQLCCFY